MEAVRKYLSLVALSCTMLVVGSASSGAQSEESFSVKFKAWVTMEHDAIQHDNVIDPLKV